MAGRKNETRSETFGRYENSTAYEKDKRAEGPKNISPDLWAPISGGEAHRSQPRKSEKNNAAKKSAQKPANRPTQKKTQKKPASSAQKAKKSAPPISEGRVAASHDAKPDKSKKNKSRRPKGRPVSELAAAADERYNKSKAIREQRERSKADSRYDKERKDGKSPAEISKERAAVKKKKRVRRNIAITALFIVFVVAFLGIYIYAKGTPVANIVVEGDSIYTSKQIIEASGVEKGVNMFTVSESKVNAAVCSGLPYIHSVDVKRKLPDSIIMTVTPTNDRYLIANGKQYICVDGYDVIVSDEGKKLEDGFFRIKGFEKQEFTVGTAYIPSENNAERYGLVKEIFAATEKHDNIRKGVINISDMRNVRFYCNGVMIYLGNCFDTDKQITDAANILRTQFAEGEKGYINAKTSVPAFQKGTTKAD